MEIIAVAGRDCAVSASGSTVFWMVPVLIRGRTRD
ncbi:hypothetical protein P3T25_005471 [Paraburkholderia sp. GAS32]